MKRIYLDYVMSVLIASAFLMLLQVSTVTASKLAFLAIPRQHHHQQLFSSLQLRTAKKIYPIHRSCNFRMIISAKNGDDDDDSICNVYKQVQEEDSEWYAKISQMLGTDEMEQLDTTFTCGDDEDADMNSKPRVEVRQANGKVTNDQVVGDDQSSKEDAELTLSKQAETSNESQLPAVISQPPINSSNVFDEDMVESRVTAPHSEGHYTQFLDEEQDEDLADLEEKISINERSQTKVDSSEVQKNDSMQAQRNDDKEVESSVKQQSRIVRIYNKFTKEHENIAPLAALEKLGYKEKELQLLRPQVLELIVDDRIPRPRRGIPKRWVKSVNDDQYDEEEDDDFGWQVQVVSRTKPTKKETPKSQITGQRIDPPKDPADDVEYDRIDNEKVIKRSKVSGDEEPPSRVNEDSTQTHDVDEDVGSNKRQQSRQRQPQSEQRQQSHFSGDEQDFRRPQRYGTDRQSRRRTRSARDDSYDDRRNFNQPRRERGSGRRQRTPRRQELLIDRNPYDDDPSGNKFWMDLPMFKDFLRKEAQFRLKILGPDWKESVLDESRWRYDLYKTWLQMIDEGVGENPLYTYIDSSRPRRRRSRAQGTANYDSDFNTRAAPRKRSGERSQEKATQRRYTTDDYNMEEDGDNVQRRRSRRPQQRKSEQRSEWQSRPSQPPRREQWSNFSDLEESLMSSKREREDSRQDYQQNSYVDTRPRRRSSEAYEENEMPQRRYSTDAYVDTFEEDDQIQRPRKKMTRKEKSYEELDKASYEYE